MDVRRQLSFGRCFNPHSPLLANELLLTDSTNRPPSVSIHIRHCWRMNCPYPSCACLAGSFNPHSPLLANELVVRGLTLRRERVSIHIRHCWRMNSLLPETRISQAPGFNPHSPLLANEFGCAWFFGCLRGCFNPHSPLLANEFVNFVLALALPVVSIHIRHCWRMNLRGFARIVQTAQFQSTFAIAGE